MALTAWSGLVGEPACDATAPATPAPRLYRLGDEGGFRQYANHCEPLNIAPESITSRFSCDGFRWEGTARVAPIAVLDQRATLVRALLSLEASVSASKGRTALFMQCEFQALALYQGRSGFGKCSLGFNPESFQAGVWISIKHAFAWSHTRTRV